MLMKNISRRVGGGKLQSFWDNEIYKVVSENKDFPIYQGQPEKGCSKMKSVHHNLQFLGSQLPSENSPSKKVLYK